MQDANAQRLPGLTTDDANLHTERIKLWDDFNHAWLALGQRQLDIMQANQQHSRASQRPLPQEIIKKLGNELVRLCDGLESQGLVDYQYGVWEDQIVAGTNPNVLTGLASFNSEMQLS